MAGGRWRRRTLPIAFINMKTVPVIRILALGALSSLAACAALTEPSDRGISARSQVTPVEVFGGKTWTEVAAGFQHTCGIDTAGTAWCWGSNQYGQLGVPTVASCAEVETCARQPLAVGGGHTFTKIAAGITHTCALTAAGAAWCWGGGYSGGNAGFLGAGALQQSVNPVRVTADSAFVAIDVGAANSCALTASGQAWCWGQNGYGEVGDSSRVARLVPVPVRTTARYQQIALGLEHSCAVQLNGVASCWGHNRWGQLGTGEVPGNSFGLVAVVPARVVGSVTYRELAAGEGHSCGIRTDDVLECWGANGNAGQLGDLSGLTHRGVPGAVAGAGTWSTLASGLMTVCARSTAGSPFCWGSNYYGAVGNGQRNALPAQTPVPTLGGPFERFTGGGSHMCGLTAAQRLYCWGDRKFGQLGN